MARAALVTVIIGVLVLGFLLYIFARSPSQERIVRFGVALDGYPITSSRIAAVSSDVAQSPHIVGFYIQWPQDPTLGEFPLESVIAIHTSGAMACITWEPMFIDGKGEHAIDVDAITSGKFDGYIDRFARTASSIDAPILLRFAHEMNLERYHWGRQNGRFDSESPAAYRSLYRYVYERFRRIAPNVRWVFSPNSESVPSTAGSRDDWNRIEHFYPGSDVVDVLGIDGYNWGQDNNGPQDSSGPGWRSFRDIFHAAYQDLKLLAPEKPIFIFETASPGTPEQKLEWLTEAFSTARRWNLDGIVWFHVAKERDWRLPQVPDLVLRADVPQKPRR